jgi:hypothetical protein
LHLHNQRRGGGRGPNSVPFFFLQCLFDKLRRGTASIGQIARAEQLRDYFDVSLMKVDAPGCFALARTTGLTAYDASYLWLATTHAAALLTLDRNWALPCICSAETASQAIRIRAFLSKSSLRASLKGVADSHALKPTHEVTFYR